jgi:predicted secreted hydrolase
MAHTLTTTLVSPLAVYTGPLGASDSREYPDVRPRPLQFPQDHGAHLPYRTEWWYITGWLGQGDAAIGFQVTFFRSRTRHPDQNPSRFAPRQLMFAHVALAVPSIGRLLHADRAARAGPGLMSVSGQDTDVRMGDWRLQRQPRPKGDHYLAQMMTETFGLSFEASTQRPPVLRGNGGYSAKGPGSTLASFYYSRPHLDVQATVRVAGKEQSMRGLAWLDHEWSSSLLMPQAVGWDWIGINLFDGTSLMAFRIRDAQGNTLWRHVDWRDVNGRVIRQSYDNGEWRPSQQWRSPRSLIEYPVSFALRFYGQDYDVVPLMLDQEIDARASTGGFYWEGAVSLMRNGVPIGRGYLELTGYGERLIL